MRALRLVALSEDGEHLVLALDVPGAVDPGERFQVPVDDRLRAALRGDRPRPGQPVPDPVDALPPRVIQARIRAGETPEQVAHASGTSVERIMRFAHPVLQERTRVAEQAREAKVRLSEGAPTVPLEQFMAERLRLLGADLDAVSWDAARSDDGTWQVRAAWRAGHKSGATRWRYDIPTRTVAPVDAATMDFAEGTRLVRVVPDVPAGLAERPGVPALHHPAAGHRGGGTPAPDDERDDDAPDDQLDDDRLDDDELAAELAEDLAPAPAAPARAEDDEHEEDDEHDDVRDVVPVTGTPVEVLLATSDEIPHDLATQDTVVLGDLTGEDGEGADPRARIPAWEDIVFGVRRQR